MKSLQTTPDDSGDSIDQFLKLIVHTYEGLIEAGKLAREQLAIDPEWADKVHERSKIITVQAVHRLAAIGVKYIPPLAISECPGAKRLRNLPLDLQEKYVKEPLPLLVLTTDGGWEVLQVDFYNLTMDQAAQIFSNDGVRTEAAQRAWLEDRNAKKGANPIKADLPYRLVGKKLVVMAPCQFERKELAKILAELE